MTLAIRKHLKDAPLLHRHALGAKARIELPIDFPIGLRQQISEVFGDGFTSRSSHGFLDFVLVSG